MWHPSAVRVSRSNARPGIKQTMWILSTKIKSIWIGCAKKERKCCLDIAKLHPELTFDRNCVVHNGWVVFWPHSWKRPHRVCECLYLGGKTKFADRPHCWINTWEKNRTEGGRGKTDKLHVIRSVRQSPLSSVRRRIKQPRTAEGKVKTMLFHIK